MAPTSPPRRAPSGDVKVSALTSAQMRKLLVTRGQPAPSVDAERDEVLALLKACGSETVSAEELEQLSPAKRISASRAPADLIAPLKPEAMEVEATEAMPPGQAGRKSGMVNAWPFLSCCWSR